MFSIKINPGPIAGEIRVPPSKSQTLRAIFLASLATGRSKIQNSLSSPDTVAMIAACRALGAHIEDVGYQLIIDGVAGVPQFAADTLIDAGNSGIVLRFISAIAATTAQPVTIEGDESLQTRRTLRPLVEALTQLGASAQTPVNKDHVPLTIQGPITAGTASFSGQDSQPVSALLYASLLLSGTMILHVSHPGELPWIALTLAWFDRLGLHYKHTAYRYYEVPGRQVIKAFDYTVPGDFSTLLFPLAAAIVSRSQVMVTGLQFADPQGDKQVLDLLLRMGANLLINKSLGYIAVQGYESLQGISVDLNPMIDALPILAVVACCAQTESHLFNVLGARTKESDRITAMCTELTKMGADIEATAEGLKIRPAHLQGATVSSHQDHRIAMALAVAGLVASGETIIEDGACIDKTYKNFVEDFKQLGAKINTI